MKTTIAKKTDEKKWYLIDATDKVLGRLAPTIANKLRGKDKPIFTPHIDCGDFIIVINADKIRVTGKKDLDKKYYTHTGFLGHISETSYSELKAKTPDKPLKLAVYGMLPKNKLRPRFMEKLFIYAGESHPHESQKPVKLEI